MNPNFPCLGFFRLSLSSTAKLLSETETGASETATVPGAAKAIEFSVETNDVRVRVDGVAPTASIGMLLKAGQTYVFEGPLTAIRFIAVTGSASVQGHYYGERNTLAP